MPEKAASAQPILRSKYLPLAVIGLALAILGGTILFATCNLRNKSREQIIRQHAKLLYELWSNQAWSEETDTMMGLREPSDQFISLFQTAQLPQLNDLRGARLLDANGHFVVANLPSVSETHLPPGDVAQLRQLKLVPHFRSWVDLREVDMTLPENAPRYGPLLEVSIPMHTQGQPQLLGIAQFILDGTNVASEFQTLDRNLFLQAGATFAAGGGLLVLLLGVAFRQLQRQNQALAERTLSLLKANQELVLAAKTSAVGAVTAHLIHGLKNPLSGLQTFVTSRGGVSEGGNETDWQLAISSTRRMQNMITEIVRVLRDEESDSPYELSLEEFSSMVGAKVRPLAQEAGISFQCQLAAEAVLTNRDANLLSLILYNLIHNGIQATPRGRAVTLSMRRLGDQLICEVKDEGPGIPETQRQALFKPCRSSKEGGSGIGLAISAQLASCLGASLELKETGSSGSTFALTIAGRNNQNQTSLVSASTAT